MISLAASDLRFLTYFAAPDWPFLSILQAACQDELEWKVAYTPRSLQLCSHDEIVQAPHLGRHQ